MSESDQFGGWSIDQKVFGWILSNLQVGSSILELGSGWATVELARHYKMNSIEDASHWINLYGQHTHYILAESSSGWYDRNVLEKELPKIKYDLLLIDGPQHNKRWKLMENTDLFNWSVPIIVDDVQEGDLMVTGKRLSEEICKRPYEIISGTKKMAMVIP